VATDQIKAEEGAKFKAGRMGEYTIEKDPTRDSGLRILMARSPSTTRTTSADLERRSGMPDAHAKACQRCSISGCDVDTRPAF
jgi:hypothetical protein